MRLARSVVGLFLSLSSCTPAAPPKVATAPCPPAAEAPKGRVRIRLTVASTGAEAAAVSGHVVVAMTTATDVTSPFRLDFDRMGEVWKAAVDVPAVASGASVEIDPDLLAWPRPFSQAPSGTYRVAAHLTQPDGHVLVGPVTEVTMDPAHAGIVEVRLETPLPPPADPTVVPGVDIVRMESKLLSAFYGRPISLEAIVRLPPSYGKDKARRYATRYSMFGFGGSIAGAYSDAVAGGKTLADAKYPELVHVLLPGNIPSGHHVFADSPNQGPWGRAFVEEFVPYLEKKYALVAAPRARLLSGHSSGGWASLWMMIQHPDFFGGTWSTAPDPVDLRSFTGIDVTPGSTESFYRKKDGSPRGLMRIDGKDVLSIEDFARIEQIDGGVGPLGTFEWVFSPRGPAGLPLPLYDRATGRQDVVVQRAWAQWDIRKVLDARWATLGPKLKGKLHLFVGTADTFHLDESMAFLCDFLKSKKSDAVCEMIPGKTHFDLGGDPADATSLTHRILFEMAAAAGVK